MNAASLTDLGRALGCTEERRPAKAAGLPEHLYYAGPLSELGPAPARPPRIALAAPQTMMDREAREIAQRGEERLMRFFQTLAMRKRRRAA